MPIEARQVRLRRWPVIWILWALSFPLLDAVLNALRGLVVYADDFAGLGVLFLVAVAGACLGLVALVWSVIYLFQQRWTDFLWCFFSPFIGGAILVTVITSGVGQWIGQYPRFLVELPSLERQAEGKDYFAIRWAETGFLGQGQTEQFMVFDKTDKLSQRIKDGETEWEPKATWVQSMGFHFYRVVQVE